MLKVFQIIYSIYALLLFIILMMVFALFIIVPLLISPKGAKISFFFFRLWAGLWFFLCGVRYEIEGLEYIKKKSSYIFIFNHRSFVDAPIIPVSVPKEVHAIGKKELLKIPIFGLIVDRVAVWVDRTNPESRKASLEKVSKLIKSGVSVMIAPEGTRNGTDETLLPFKKGAFRLSAETQTPILPMAIIGADKILPKGGKLMSPGRIKVIFSQEMNPPKSSDEKSIEEFLELGRNRLEAMILTHE
ncbi:lysophospholipid acyltransferase family protein [Algoriphagus sediminis]|uniref:Lysophospholipid acyltransferase family protein n=1 Tax=Algoriphagus sediminis TaxID=3057113 RepID=A0ABT7YGM3_9BACT|nr:lysophospholipid acyltransferase family protein [Algoriphagus sediminis]MDN3205683.1 lysophospholipid acyltransferase family protein [Algoriphagus sediminis]